MTTQRNEGKSTVAAAIEDQLLVAGRWAYRLDGDNLRHGVCSDLGFSRDDRAENARRWPVKNASKQSSLSALEPRSRIGTKTILCGIPRFTRSRRLASSGS